MALPSSPRPTKAASIHALNLADPAERRRLSSAGFRAFVKLGQRLALSQDQQALLLGAVARRTYQRWLANSPEDLSRDQLERISLLLGIYKALQILFPVEERRESWLRAANSDQPFAGRSPLAYLLDGSLQHLFEARRYLDAWRGGWP
jgi:hypothetical protein